MLVRESDGRSVGTAFNESDWRLRGVSGAAGGEAAREAGEDERGFLAATSGAATGTVGAFGIFLADGAGFKKVLLI